MSFHRNFTVPYEGVIPRAARNPRISQPSIQSTGPRRKIEKEPTIEDWHPNKRTRYHGG